MKQTLKLSAPMVLLLSSMAMMGEESGVTSHTNRYALNEIIHNKEMITSETDAKPVFAENGDKVYMSLDNPDLVPIYIEVRDGLGRLLFSETIAETNDIVKSFNFNKAFKGHYTIKVNNGSNSFSKEIEIM